MGYTIMRAAKMKSKGNIGGSTAHTFRERETRNADPALLKENLHMWAKSSAEVMQRMEERWATQTKQNKKGETVSSIRSNAVLAIEYLITHTNGHTNDAGESPSENGYFTDAVKYLVGKHGAKNVISAHIHNDETTPHMVVYVVPIDKKGKLNCREFLGGAKKLNEFQTDFHEEVGAKQGLERGVEWSGARHTTLKEYYGHIAKAQKLEKSPEPTKKDYALAAAGLKPDVVWAQEELAEYVKTATVISELGNKQLAPQRKKLSKLESELDTKEESLTAKEARLNNRQDDLRESERNIAARENHQEHKGLNIAKMEKSVKKDMEKMRSIMEINCEIQAENRKLGGVSHKKTPKLINDYDDGPSNDMF